MKKPFRYPLLGFLLLIITINCKAEEFYKGSWDENECIQGNWKDNAYCKLGICQSYYKNNEWYHRLLFYSKYAYAFDYNEEEEDKECIAITFLNKEDYTKTKTAWQRELPDYVLKRMVFIDKYLRIRFLKIDDNSFEGRENTYKIFFGKAGSIGLEEFKQQFPNAKELSR